MEHKILNEPELEPMNPKLGPRARSARPAKKKKTKRKIKNEVRTNQNVDLHIVQNQQFFYESFKDEIDKIEAHATNLPTQPLSQSVQEFNHVDSEVAVYRDSENLSNQFPIYVEDPRAYEQPAQAFGQETGELAPWNTAQSLEPYEEEYREILAHPFHELAPDFYHNPPFGPETQGLVFSNISAAERSEVPSSLALTQELPRTKKKQLRKRKKISITQRARSACPKEPDSVSVLKAPVPEVNLDKKKLAKNQSAINLDLYKPKPPSQFRELFERKKNENRPRVKSVVKPSERKFQQFLKNFSERSFSSAQKPEVPTPEEKPPPRKFPKFQKCPSTPRRVTLSPRPRTLTKVEQHTTQLQTERVLKVRRDKEERIRKRTEALTNKQTGLKRFKNQINQALQNESLSRIKEGAESRFRETEDKLERSASRRRSRQAHEPNREYKSMFEEHRQSQERPRPKPEPKFSVEKVELQQTHLMTLRAKIKEQYLASKKQKQKASEEEAEEDFGKLFSNRLIKESLQEGTPRQLEDLDQEVVQAQKDLCNIYDQIQELEGEGNAPINHRIPAIQEIWDEDIADEEIRQPEFQILPQPPTLPQVPEEAPEEEEVSSEEEKRSDVHFSGLYLNAPVRSRCSSMMVRDRPSVVLNNLVAKKNSDLSHLLSQKVSKQVKRAKEKTPTKEEMEKVKQEFYSSWKRDPVRGPRTKATKPVEKPSKPVDKPSISRGRSLQEVGRARDRARPVEAIEDLMEPVPLSNPMQVVIAATTSEAEEEKAQPENLDTSDQQLKTHSQADPSVLMSVLPRIASFLEPQPGVQVLRLMMLSKEARQVLMVSHGGSQSNHLALQESGAAFHEFCKELKGRWMKTKARQSLAECPASIWEEVCPSLRYEPVTAMIKVPEVSSKWGRSLEIASPFDGIFSEFAASHRGNLEWIRQSTELRTVAFLRSTNPPFQAVGRVYLRDQREIREGQLLGDHLHGFGRIITPHLISVGYFKVKDGASVPHGRLIQYQPGEKRLNKVSDPSRIVSSAIYWEGKSRGGKVFNFSEQF